MKHFAGAVATAIAILTASAHAQTSYEGVTRPHAERLDNLIVATCTQNDRIVRWLALEEIAYALRGDREVRDSGTRIFKESYEATGCGAPPRRLHVQVFHGGTQAPEPLPMLLPPGETTIDVGTMINLFRTHMPQLMAIRHPACRAAPAGQPVFLVTDTRVIRGEAFVPNEMWTERWAYRACGEAAEIDISFTSDGERLTMLMSLETPAATP